MDPTTPVQMRRHLSTRIGSVRSEKRGRRSAGDEGYGEYDDSGDEYDDMSDNERLLRDEAHTSSIGLNNTRTSNFFSSRRSLSPSPEIIDSNNDTGYSSEDIDDPNVSVYQRLEPSFVEEQAAKSSLRRTITDVIVALMFVLLLWWVLAPFAYDSVKDDYPALGEFIQRTTVLYGGSPRPLDYTSGAVDLAELSPEQIVSDMAHLQKRVKTLSDAQAEELSSSKSAIENLKKTVQEDKAKMGKIEQTVGAKAAGSDLKTIKSKLEELWIDHNSLKETMPQSVYEKAQKVFDASSGKLVDQAKQAAAEAISEANLQPAGDGSAPTSGEIEAVKSEIASLKTHVDTNLANKADLQALEGSLKDVSSKVDTLEKVDFPGDAAQIFAQLQGLAEFKAWQKDFQKRLPAAASAGGEGGAALSIEFQDKLSKLEEDVDGLLKFATDVKPEIGASALAQSLKDNLEKLDGEVRGDLESVLKQLKDVKQTSQKGSDKLAKDITANRAFVQSVQSNLQSYFDQIVSTFQVQFPDGKTKSLDEVVERLVDNYQYGDREGEIDWFSATTGSRVIAVKSPDYKWSTFGEPVEDKAIITPSKQYRCFALKGSHGEFTVRLSRGIVPQKFAYEMPLKNANPAHTAAAKTIEVYGTSSKFINPMTGVGEPQHLVKLSEHPMVTSDEGGWQELPLARGQSDETGLEGLPLLADGTKDLHGLDMGGSRLYDVFVVRIVDNHGSADCTCVWRVRMYGMGPSVADWQGYKQWRF